MASFFNLRPGSLNNSSGDRNGCPVPGTLINTNNMRGFQDLDRELLLKAEAKKILHDIISGNVEENPALLLRFLATSFADLKNWKVYYNVAFPSLVLNSRMTLLSLHCASELLSKEEVISYAPSIEEHQFPCSIHPIGSESCLFVPAGSILV
jgi:ubiquitin-like modifier-activating enzyme ATG7